jgi:transposase
MARTHLWILSEELWEKVKNLVPLESKRDEKRDYKRRKGGGRKRANPKLVLAAIVRVLRTGCQWNSLTLARDGVSSSSVHRYFLEWTRRGVFLQIWQNGLAEYNELKGISWSWQAVDGNLVKAPLAQEAVGPNPTDRGKNGSKIHLLCDEHGIPLSFFVSAANLNDCTGLERLLHSCVCVQEEFVQNVVPENLSADAGYTGYAETIYFYGYIPHIRPRHEEAQAIRTQGFKARRWIVESVFSWLHRERKVNIRYEKTLLSYMGLVTLAIALIVYKKIIPG